MKKLFALLLSIVFVLSTITVTAFAVTDNKATETAYSAVSRLAKDPFYMLDIEIVPHKKDNPKRSAVWDGSIADGFAGGTGTEEDPYLISDGSELAYLAQEVNNGNYYSEVYFKLTNDIYLNDTSDWESWGNGTAPENEWTPIGVVIGEEYHFFSGFFNGNGYAVRGIYIDTQEDYQGLFGLYNDYECDTMLANLGVAESYISGGVHVGGLVGYSSDGTVTNCYNTGNVVGVENVGGVVGKDYYVTLSGCYNSGSVSGSGSYIGGVVGSNWWETSSVVNCYNVGNVSGGSYVGGVAGVSTGTIINCYNTGSITGTDSVGGVIGNNRAYGIVTECNNSGAVIGSSMVGGIIGENTGDYQDRPNVTNCYNTGSVTGENTVGGVIGTTWASGHSIDNCYNMGSVTGTGDSIGGVSGFAGVATTNCYNMGDVTGASDVGGISGINCTCAMTNCYNTGNVTASGDYIGGLFGHTNGSASSNGVITNCYNAGNVTGRKYVGGFAGLTNDTTTTNSYNTGNISGTRSVGGMFGSCEGVATNCYNIGIVIGYEEIGGVVGYNPGNACDITNCYYYIDCCESDNYFGTPLTMEELMLAESFVGFDFSSVWTMDGNPDYPYPELIGNIHVGTSIVSPEPGDANGDGRVTMADATIIARMALNLAVSAPAADFDGDGRVTMADATLTARKALNLI